MKVLREGCVASSEERAEMEAEYARQEGGSSGALMAPTIEN
jgi:hypothetical protein